MEADADSLVTLNIPVADFAFFDVSKKCFVIEPGEYQLMVGSSSRDIREQISFEVK